MISPVGVPPPPAPPPPRDIRGGETAGLKGVIVPVLFAVGIVLLIVTIALAVA